MAMAELHLPAGWIRAGSDPDRYEMGVAARGDPALIRSRAEPAPAPAGSRFGTLMQSILADKFRGRRVRLSAELKTEHVVGAGTIWMRVDGAQRKSLSFDNMETRPVNGVVSDTSDWTRREVVLEVPANAESIHFGFYLRGTGQTWARNFALQAVADDTPATSGPRTLLDGPTNLDFSQLAEDS